MVGTVHTFILCDFSPAVKLLCDLSDNKMARPIVPIQHQQLIIGWLHNLSHPGQKETLRRVGANYYWPSMRKDVSKFITICHPCNAAKPHRVITPPMDPRPNLAPHFKDLQIDVVGPMVPSEGHKYLLTVLDRTSRFFTAIPMTAATPPNCASAFIRGWVSTFGLPAKAMSDSGNVFISKLWQEMHKELGSIIEYSPLYSASSLGGVERAHKDLKNSLKATLLAMNDTHQEKWMAILPWTLLSMRMSFHSELQASPAEVLFG